MHISHHCLLSLLQHYTLARHKLLAKSTVFLDAECVVVSVLGDAGPQQSDLGLA